MDLSACSFALMVACAPAGSLFCTWMFSTVPPSVSLTPAQRCSRPTFPASWITQSALVTPASFILLAGTLTGDRLVLTDVGDGAELGRTCPGRS